MHFICYGDIDNEKRNSRNNIFFFSVGNHDFGGFIKEPKMKKLNELITNTDGRLSTTGTIQFGGALLMAIILAICVYLDRSYVPELFMTFAIFCGGGVATKGFANAMERRQGGRE